MKNKTKKDETIKSLKKNKLEEKKEADNKSTIDDKEKKKKKVRKLKCEFCQNLINDPKKTLNFSCQHQLCPVCISHSILRNYFKCITNKTDLITLQCNECLKHRALEPGFAQVPMSFILSALKDTYKIRNKKQRGVCLSHNMDADYCIACGRWICEECKKSFHKSNFPTHSVFTTEEPFSFKKCPKHGDRPLDLFCTDCAIDICSSCAFKGGEHSKHNIISMAELKRKILKERKKYKFQSMDEFEDYLQKLQFEFKNTFEESYKQKSELISEITTILQNFYDRFFSYKEKMENFIENYFSIIRACYFNYFKDIEEREPRMNSLEFIESIDREISHFDFDSKYTEELQKIKEQLDLIIPTKFFEYKLRFFNHSFKCINVIKDIIKEEKSKEENKEKKKDKKKEKNKDNKKEESKAKKIKETPNQIYCLTQLKNGNILTGGSKGILNVWDLNTGKKVDSIKAHKGNIYSVIELSDGRLVSSGSDSWIKFWNIKNEQDVESEPKVIELIPRKSKEKELKQEPKKVEEKKENINNNQTELMNNNINSNINSMINNNNINNTNIINTTSEVPIKKDNENISLSKPLFNQSDLNNIPSNIKIPGNENIGMNMGINSGMNLGNISNQNTMNQQTIKEIKEPDAGYGGNGIHNNYQNDVEYGSSGIAQSNIQNTQVVQGNNINNLNSTNNFNNNNINNLNINSQMPNMSNESQNNINPSISGININNNAPWLEKTGFGENKLNLVNNDNNNNINNLGMTTNSNLDKNISESINKENSNGQNTKFNIELNAQSGLSQNFNSINNNNSSSNMNPNMNTISNFNNTNLNTNVNPNPPVNQSIQEQKPEEVQKQEDKKEEEKKLDDEYNDLFTGLPPENNMKDVANPPKKPDTINEIEEIKSNYICKIKLYGHLDDVNCIFEVTGKKLVSCGKDGNILVWSLDSLEKPIKIKGHERGVGCGIELKENFIVTGGSDFYVKIWDISIDDLLKPDIILKGHKNAIFALSKINEKKLASASCDKSIRIWDLNYNSCTHILDGHSGFIWSLVNIVKYIKDVNNKDEAKNLLVSASSDKTIKFWDMEDYKCIKTIFAHDKEITTLGKLNDGNIISGSLDSTIKVWKV